jgi:hypothetical protein
MMAMFVVEQERMKDKVYVYEFHSLVKPEGSRCYQLWATAALLQESFPAGVDVPMAVQG